MLHQLVNEILGLRGSKLFIEGNDQQMFDTKRANHSDFVGRRGEQVRCFFRPQYFLGVGIKGDYHRRAIRRLSVLRRSRNDCLMSEMDPVEDTNGEKELAG